MYRVVIGIASAVGAAIGVLSAIADGIGTMIVMGVIGAAFGGPLGGGLCALLRGFKRQVSDRRGADEKSGSGIDPYVQMNLARQWMDDQERSPIVGDPDPAAKSVTGWRDVADVARDRDILSRD